MRTIPRLLLFALCACGTAKPPSSPAQDFVQRPPPRDGHVVVPTPARAIRAGEALTTKNIQWVQLPADLVPAAALQGWDSAIGRVVAEPLVAHELIRPERLAETPAPTPLTRREPLMLSRSFDDEEPPTESPVWVIVAGARLPAGSTIDKDQLYAVEVLARYAYAGVFLNPSVVGRTVCHDILPNEFVHASRLDVDGTCPE